MYMRAHVGVCVTRACRGSLVLACVHKYVCAWRVRVGAYSYVYASSYTFVRACVRLAGKKNGFARREPAHNDTKSCKSSQISSRQKPHEEKTLIATPPPPWDINGTFRQPDVSKKMSINVPFFFRSPDPPPPQQVGHLGH